MKLLVAGCGYLGEALARAAVREKWEVIAVSRSQPQLVVEGGSCAAADISSWEDVRRLGVEPDVFVHCASSRGGDAAAYRRVYLEGMRNLTAAFPDAFCVFTGSTSVYGQVGGEWVDEASPAQPPKETGCVLLEAEAVSLSAGGAVARLAGLYGPGRSVLLRKYLEGTARLEGDGSRWINQIHREDAATALLRLCSIREAGIFNVADDSPARQRDVYGWIADFTGGELPPRTGEVKERKRGASDKRVSNVKLRARGWQPSYSSYRDALPELLR